MSKLVTIIISLLFFATFITSISFNYIGLKYYWVTTHKPVVDDRIQAIESVTKVPSIFKLPDDYTKRIKELYVIYKTIKEENKDLYKEFGSTVDEIKNECIAQAVALIGSSSTKDFRARKVFTVGGLSHGLSAYVIDTEKMNDDEVTTYVRNITKILEAVPRNLPDKDTLTSKNIINITYYADYARIVYDIDRQIDRINHDETNYYGLRFEDKLKGGKKK